MLTNLTTMEVGHLRRKLQRVCDQLELVRHLPPSEYLYRVNALGSPPSSSACDDLRRRFGDES
ncbi:MAG: hypothetical protein IPF87_16840 [Gemmatimonadetes bacterium]|nr:hypothetical protein [Gemmatimonadota bacterium]